MFDWLVRLLASPLEKRMADIIDISGTDSYLDGLQGYYETGGQANVYQTAAVEFSLGLVSRAFMGAVAVPELPALSPSTLSMIARQTVALGNSVHAIEVARTGPRRGQIRLLPVADYDVSGGVDPDSWFYAVEQERPTGEAVKRTIPAAGVVHVKYAEPSIEALGWCVTAYKGRADGKAACTDRA